MKLRPYQRKAIDEIKKKWEVNDRVMIKLATGTGKTIVFSKLLAELKAEHEAAGKPFHALILAHRGELLDQASDKLAKATGITSALEKSEHSAVGSDDAVVVGSVQTLQSYKRLAAYDPYFFD